MKEFTILLVQVRDDEILEQEYNCYVDKLAEQPIAWKRLSVFTDALDASSLEGIDAVLFGGAGAYNIALNDLPNQDDLLAFARLVVEKRIPIFGVCYGAHVLTAALGGEVVRDEERAEVGTYTVTLTPQAAQCPVFSARSETFTVQQGHKDHMTRVPEGAVVLAGSERSPIQAWTLPGAPVYAVQFHPEMNAQDVIDRVTFYQELYTQDAQTFDKMRNATKPSPEATEVMCDVVEKVMRAGTIFPQA